MRSLLGPGLPLIALALVACRPPAQPAPESPGCEAPRHRAASGACVDCLHDADCPVGQRCDPLAGVCAPPRPPVDAGPGPGCAPTGLRCSADLGAVQECQAFADGGTDWVTTQLCDGLTCDTDLRVCKVCQPRTELCLPDAGSGAYARCRDNGTGYDSLSCSAGFVCLDVGPGAISCRLCEPNSLTCATAPDGGQGILSCDATGKVQAYHSCYPTNLCTNTDEGPTCGSFICYPGSHQCAFPDGGSMPDYTSPARQVCSTDGRSWLDDPCPADTLCGPMGQDPGACLTPCDQVLQSDQDLGCDFWAR